MSSWKIKGHVLEYIDSTHTYICDGEIIPSITQIMKIKFGNKYDGVGKDVLTKAAQKGTAVHEAIERYCKTGEVKDLKEVKNFIFLQKYYGFEVLDNELPILLFKDNKPIAAGRLDLVLDIKGSIGIGDIKRTATLDKEYLTYQLNLYRIGYQQSYDKKVKYLSGLHLRENTRKYVNIAINEEKAMELVEEYLKEGNYEYI